MKFFVVAAAWLLAGSPALAADTPVAPAPDTNALAGMVSTFEVDQLGLHGPGAERLATEIKKAQYVLIGEDHLSREIPLFASGVCRLMAPDGLDAFAVEVGPEAARVVNQTLRRPDRVSRLSAFLQSHRDVMAFQNGQDESDMAATCARVAGPKFQMWGLDQEFFGATGFLLEEMLAAHPGPVSKKKIIDLQGLEKAAAQKAVASGNPGAFVLFNLSDEQMTSASKAIQRDGGPRVISLFNAMAKTRDIYIAQNKSGFASNRARSLLMKQTLVEYLKSAGPKPRLLFKFGDVHTVRGINGLGQLDLGNFVSERADGEGVTSLNIAVYGLKGVHAQYAGVARNLDHQPFVMTDDPDYAWLKELLALRTDTSPANAWTVIDLKALRFHAPKTISADLRAKLRGVDLLVLAPELSPSALIEPGL